MNRRSFLAKIAGAIMAGRLAVECGASKPSEDFGYRTETYELNPQWVTAKYENLFILDENPPRFTYSNTGKTWVRLIEGGPFPHGMGNVT